MRFSDLRHGDACFRSKIWDWILSILWCQGPAHLVQYKEVQGTVLAVSPDVWPSQRLEYFFDESIVNSQKPCETRNGGNAYEFLRFGEELHFDRLERFGRCAHAEAGGLKDQTT